MNPESGHPRTVARSSNPFRAVPEWLWVPVVGGGLLVLCGMLGLAAGQMWLFPSLGPTAFMQAAYPKHVSARFYNVLAGHAIGIGAAALAVWTFGLEDQTAVFLHQNLAWRHIWASGLALALTLFLQQVFQASHPPAGATALLLTLGEFKLNGHDLSVILVGVFLLAVIGELLRRARVS